MPRRAGVFAAAGHRVCARCGHPRFQHIDRRPMVCSATTWRTVPMDQTTSRDIPARCTCPGYRAKRK